MRSKYIEPSFMEFVRDFMKTYLPKHKCCSLSTISTYRTALDQALTFIASRKKIPLIKLTFQDMTRDNLMAFLDEGTSNRHWTATTRNLKLYAIRSFLNYCGQMDAGYMIYALGASNIPEQKDARGPVIKYFDIGTLEIILSMPDISTLIGYRDMVMMAFMFDTGCRVSELVSIQLGDIRDMKEQGGIVTIHGKGRKVRNTPLTLNMTQHIKAYRKKFHHNATPYNYLFYCSRSGPRQSMSPDNVQRIIDKYVKAAKEKYPDFEYSHISPHAFRHARAMFMLQKGIPLNLIGTFLGHSSPETTKMYASPDASMKRKAIEKAIHEHHPLAQKLKELDATLSDEETRALFGLR